MKLTGNVWKEGRFWIVHVPALHLDTQGFTRKEALKMAEDWVQSALNDPHFKVDITVTGKSELVMGFNDPKPILALMIERTRSASGLTYAEVANKLDLKSRSNIKSLTNGKHDPGFTKILKLLEAMGYDIEIGLKKRA